MRYASFVVGGSASWGIVEDAEVLDLGAAVASLPDLKSAIAAGAMAEFRSSVPVAKRHPFAAIRWLPVIPNPGKIFCVGLNYEKHREETGRSEVEHPTIFARYADSQTAHLAPIVRPIVSDKLDFEGELAVIIGKSGRYVGGADAMSHVAGYSLYNDGSVRDFQWHTHQFTPGKNFPQTGAFGPWMVTPDEVGDLAALRLRTRVNGATVQDAALGEMIFDVARQIEYCSSFTKIEPGDVIATGTPGGVGAKRSPPRWLEPGDTIEVEIDRIGTLCNEVKDEAAA